MVSGTISKTAQGTNFSLLSGIVGYMENPEQEKHPFADTKFTEVLAASEFAKYPGLLYVRGDTEEALRANAQLAAAKSCWWLGKKMKDRDVPRTQVVFEFSSDLSITLYAYADLPLNEGQLAGVSRALTWYATVAGGEQVLQKIKWIVLTDNEIVNVKSGGFQRAETFFNQSVTFFTRVGSSTESYERIPQTDVSMIEAVTLHEYAHAIMDQYAFDRTLREDWKRQFAWKYLDEPKKLAGGMEVMYACDEPERCINEYARSDPSEDFCESLVAAVYAPQSLDPIRLQMLQERILNKSKQGSAVALPNITTMSGGEVRLPDPPKEVFYTRALSPKIVWK